MGLFDWFKRKPPIASRADVAEFIDTRAAFMVQKNIFDYSHALTGPYYSKLITEPAFKDAVDRSRWQSYPLALACIAEMVHVALLAGTRDSRGLAEALGRTTLEVFDRYPVPKVIGDEAWASSRAALVQRLNGISLHPPKPIKDIPVPVARQIYDNLPFDEQLRKEDFTMVSHHLRVNLVRMYEDFTKRARLQPILAELLPAAEAAAAKG